MSNGKGCKCNAHCEHECCCDADWTTKEVYDLRAEVARLTAERDEAREQLRLANIDQFNSEAEVAALKAEEMLSATARAENAARKGER